MHINTLYWLSIQVVKHKLKYKEVWKLAIIQQVALPSVCTTNLNYSMFKHSFMEVQLFM